MENSIIKKVTEGILASALCLLPAVTNAQLSSNPDKFLGNITTRYQMDAGGGVEPYYKLWNQVTPENETKWGSIEGTRGSYNWNDAAYNYAKKYNFPFKFHCLVWGSQYPNWINSLSADEQYKAIVKWMDAVKKHYPDLPLIDVVNEAVPGHAPAPYKEALGGDGKTGYDWIIKAFELAHERWPDAILIYNDYNTFQWQKTEFINLVRTLRDAGAPIDAYGCQSHDCTDLEFSSFKSAMTEIQNALKMPMYSSEYDIGTTDDALQLKRYKEQIPYMWEQDYCAGITLWGYIYGATWTTDGNSGIIRNGKDRPAMEWLRGYMKTDEAKNAKSPFPGMVKEASVYIKPTALNVTKQDTMTITVDARLKTKEIDHIDLYIKNKLYCRLDSAPYVVEYVPETIGKYALKAVVMATDSTTYERLGGFTANNPRSAFKTVELPGTIQAEDFDKGGEGISYHDTDTQNEGGTSYRSDAAGVDIVTGNGGYAIGYTSSGEWLEYTVNVKEAGLYEIDTYASSGVTNSSFCLYLDTDAGSKKLTDTFTVPCLTSNSWDKYSAVHGRSLVELPEGKVIIRLSITGSSCNIDKMVFNRIEVDSKIKVTVSADPNPATVSTDTKITVGVTPSADTIAINSVKVYVNNVLNKTLKISPYEFTYKPTAKGTDNFVIEALDASGHVSPLKTFALKVNNKRSAYKSVTLPGTLQAENFDKGGEGLSFHDSDSEDEGKAGYRTDNEGVDITSGNGGYVIGYTAANEWLEYTVKVSEAGQYTYEATVSSGTSGSAFTISLMDGTKATKLCTVSVPQTASNSWDTYQVVKGKLGNLEEGTQVLRITITGAYCNIDKIKFVCSVPAGISEIEETDADAPRYNLGGQQVDNAANGVIIIDGKKYLKK